LITRVRRAAAVVVVVVIIIIIIIQELLADFSTCGDNMGSADVDNVRIAHDTILEVIELDVTADK